MTITHTHVCPLHMPVSFSCLHLVLVQKVRTFQKIEKPQATLICTVYVSILEVLLSQFEWNSRDLPTETRLTDRYRSTGSLSFMTPANFPHAVTVRRMANDVTYTMYAALPICLCCLFQQNSKTLLVCRVRVL